MNVRLYPGSYAYNVDYKITVDPRPFSDQNTRLTNQTYNRSAIYAEQFLVEVYFDTLNAVSLLLHTLNGHWPINISNG